MKISGIVEVNNDVDIYQFWDEFIDFIESKGYYYGARSPAPERIPNMVRP